MDVIVHCISLRVVRHSDSTSIVTAWTAERGRMVFAVPAGSGREAQRRRALMMPLGMFEGVAHMRHGSDIARISGVRPFGVGNAAWSDPLKNVMSLFLADFLYVMLRESQPDERLSQFVFDSVRQLRDVSGTALANFHLYFTYRLGQFVGVSPDVGSYHRGWYFDMAEGVFTPTMPMRRTVLLPDRARIIPILAASTPWSLGHLKMNHAQRNEVLDGILEYYTMHHAPVSQLPSLSVLRGLFG